MNINILFAFLIAIILGTTHVAYRIISEKVSHHFIIFVSAIVYYVCTLIYIYTFHYKQVSNDFGVDYRYILALVITVIASFFLTNLMYFYAIKHTDNISLISIIISTYPAITLLVAYFVLKEKLSIPALIGFAFIFIGLILLAYK